MFLTVAYKFAGCKIYVHQRHVRGRLCETFDSGVSTALSEIEMLQKFRFDSSLEGIGQSAECYDYDKILLKNVYISGMSRILLQQ